MKSKPKQLHIPFEGLSNYNRFVRLQSFFEPYPNLVPYLDQSLDCAISIQIVTKRSETRYIVRLSPMLLEQNSPDWVETAILNCARTYVHLLRNHPDELRNRLLKLYDFERLALLHRDLCPKPPAKKRRNKSNQLLSQIWKKLQSEYFPDRQDLLEYHINWSARRQTRTLASCNPHSKRIAVSKAMDNPSAEPDLEALIYHEMCHAVLGPAKRVRGRRQVHGRDFHLLEQRHVGIKALNVWLKNYGWHKVAKEFSRRQKENSNR